MREALPYTQHSFPTLQDLSGHYFPTLKFGAWATNTFRIPHHLKCSSEVGVHARLACVSALCSLWTEHVGLPLGRVGRLLDASPPPDNADSPGSQSGKETVTKALAICCLSGNLTHVWQFVILKCKMAAKSHCVSCYEHMEKCWQHRLFGLRSVSPMELVK